jgi:hypothetical protein
VPTPLDIVRPHKGGCRHCAEYDLAGNELPTSGHYVCQATDCETLADYTWPRQAGDDTEPVLSCERHALPAEVRDKPHLADCPAPDPGCSCAW